VNAEEAQLVQNENHCCYDCFDIGSFQVSAAPSASLPWHIIESCNEKLESLKLNFTLTVSSSATKQRAVKRNQSVMAVVAIVFSVITDDLVLLASDPELWIVLLTVLLGLFLRAKGFR